MSAGPGVGAAGPGVLDHGHLACLSTYAAQKDYFEKFVAKVGTKGFALPLEEGGCKLLKAGPLADMFGDVEYYHVGDGEPEEFMKQWLKDNDKRFCKTINFVPAAAGQPVPQHGDVYNLFRGMGPLSEDAAGVNVGNHIKAWRAVGQELCEGDASKFKFLEQWLAHIFQFPAERSNISFAFLGSEQGVFKNAFFAPVELLLGEVNCLETTNIHNVVQSSRKATQLDAKLLVVLDEAVLKNTRHFQRYGFCLFLFFIRTLQMTDDCVFAFYFLT